MALLDDKTRRALMSFCILTLHTERGPLVDAVDACRTIEDGKKLWLKHADLPKLRPDQSTTEVESILSKMPGLTNNDFWWAEAWRAEHGADASLEAFLAEASTRLMKQRKGLSKCGIVLVIHDGVMRPLLVSELAIFTRMAKKVGFEARVPKAGKPLAKKKTKASARAPTTRPSRRVAHSFEEALALGPLVTSIEYEDVLGAATMPKRIDRLVNLTRINVDKQGLRTLPDELASLPKLRELDLGANHFATVPAVVFRLSKLTLLDLGGNSFGDLPAAIGKLTALEFLGLATTSVEKLPSAIGRLTKLAKLALQFSFIASVPAALAMCPLREINVKGTPLSRNAREMKKLRALAPRAKILA